MSEIVTYIPEQADLDRINEVLEEYNLSVGAPPHIKKSIALKFVEKGKILGDVTAEILMGQMYVPKLCVDKTARKLGIGKRLMQKLEEMAITEKCTNIAVCTYTWQGEGFYELCGFREFGRIKVDTKGHFEGREQYKIFYIKDI